MFSIRGRDAAAESVIPGLLQLGAPEPHVVGPSRPDTSAGNLDERAFYILGQRVRLPSPIDWQSRSEGRSWRYQLQSLTWLRPVVARHARHGDISALNVVLDIVMDWATEHCQDPSVADRELSEFTWYDMAVGLRAPYIAYALRAGLHEDALDPSQTQVLVDVAQQHGRELADPAKYAHGHNHGLFQDEGLYILAEQLPTLPLSAAWRAIAKRRLLATLRGTVAFDEGSHLEHSAAYHFAIYNLVQRLCRTVTDLDALHDLLPRLRQTAALYVTPRGRLVQLGDTDDVEAPQWALDATSDAYGLRPLFRAGQAFVRTPTSYLAVTAGYHSAGHKQADETSVVLVEGDETLLGDAGRWGYYEDDPDRRYARSSRAHNVLVVDDADFEWRGTQPYGSALIATGEGDGWHAILVSNPLLTSRGVSHRRLIAYRPGTMLIVVDHVDAASSHNYTRYFHFGPGIVAARTEHGVAMTGRTVVATLRDPDPSTMVEIARGQDEPERLGWTYPEDRTRVPVCTAVLRSHGATTINGCCLTLTDTSLATPPITTPAGAYVLTLTNRQSVAVTRKDATLSVETIAGT